MQVWEFAHGQDSRLVEAPQARKSIGAQVYYGVRLDGDADADKFLDDLAGPTLIQTPSCPPCLITYMASSGAQLAMLYFTSSAILLTVGDCNAGAHAGLTLGWHAGHLSVRLVEAGVKGRHLTLKIKRKKAGAPEPVKFLVCPHVLDFAIAPWVDVAYTALYSRLLESGATSMLHVLKLVL